MSGDKRARLKQWLESGEARLHPLTHPQRELWEASPVAVSDPAHHICCLIKIGGLILPEDCRVAIQRVVDRQEALRISFLPGKEQPLQMVRKSGEVGFAFRELSAAQKPPEAIEEVAREIFQQPFDLLQGPLHRVEVLRRDPSDHVIVMSTHHAVADGWTLGVYVRDLCAAYLQGMMGLREALPPVELTYTAWAAAERAYWQPAELARRLEFWHPKLAGAPRLWSGHAPLLSPLQRSVFDIPAELTAAARMLAKRTGATLFSTLLAVFQITVFRRFGADDLTVGTPVANRSKQNTRETMGYFSGVVPIRGQVDPAASLADAVRVTHQETIDAFANAMPFAELVKGVGEPNMPGRNPIYDVRFALQNHPVPDVSLPQLSARLRMRSTGTPRCELGCEITETGDTLEVVWLSRPQRFSAEEIVDLHGLFQATLTQACRSPEVRISALT